MLAGMSDALPGTGRHDHNHDGTGHGHDHGAHDHGAHEHQHGEHDHRHRSGLLAGLLDRVRPHSHDVADKVDAAMEASAEGLRALWISLTVLAATAVLQAIVVAFSGSVALLGDTLHNAADALTAVPLAVAFVIGRRPPTRRYTYGYGRGPGRRGHRLDHCRVFRAGRL
jgi:Co/Zn/Cd efflux system component